ncbi:MAG: hypothetical protein B7Z54_08700 [Sphingobacteriales bacterium 12-47-4]|nr:MAG: hypothetical protein B7Z54_08700 [Sphingobacteriales bacterium 12-47-4]
MRNIFLILLLSVASLTKLSAQVQAHGATSIVIEGTSNIHDWEMKSDKGECNASYTLNSAGVLTSHNSLLFNIKAETLKSGKSAMDKNTYKAIGTEKYPYISFTSTSATVKHNGGNSYTITSAGKLTIASVTRQVTLVANCTLTADKSLRATGSYKIKMTDYNVTPPSIMFGAIKTGNEVTIKYDLTLKGR